MQIVSITENVFEGARFSHRYNQKLRLNKHRNRQFNNRNIRI